MTPFTETDLTRFAAKTHDVPAKVRPWWTGDGYQPTAVACREWVGAVNTKGYGRFWTGGFVNGQPVNRQCWTAHKFAYAAAHGPIPDGWVVDRLCRNIRCVHPDHLQAVTQAESQRRTFVLHPPRRRDTSSACRNGHLWSEHGRRYSGVLRCGECFREQRRKAYAAKVGLRAPRDPRTTCHSGRHAWTEANIYTSPKGVRYCRPCQGESARRYQERKRAHPTVA